MYEFYHQTVPTAVQKVTRRSLRNLYEAIPDTEGCIENINKDSGCGGWCCQIQNPQVMFSEFLLTWNQITHNWTKSQLIDLICRAISSYIDTKPTKGCVFWDSQTKLCGQHETRPFNCRTYAQVPEEDFKPRFEALKILYQDQPDADLRNQCGLVKTVGKKPTTADIDSWFAELTLIERDFGIRQSLINDKPGGSYRTYHDHILLHICGDHFLARIAKAREKTKEEKSAFVASVKSKLEKEVTDLTNIKL